MPGRMGSNPPGSAGLPSNPASAATLKSAAPQPQEEEAPEPQVEATGKWEQRMDELMVRLQEAVGAKDFRKALQVQKEMELVTRSMETSDGFDKKIEAAEGAMLKAAERQSYLEAEQHREEVEFLKMHKDEVLELETQMLALEISFLQHTTSQGKVDLHKAWDVRKEVELLEGIKDEMRRKEERLGDLREALRRALCERNFAGAETLKEQIQQLRNYNPVTAMRPDLTPVPLPDDAQPPARSPSRAYPEPASAPPSQPPQANPPFDPRNPMSQAHPSFVPALPQLQAPHAPAPSAVAADDIVANLAAMIWRSSCADGQAGAQAPQLQGLSPMRRAPSAAGTPGLQSLGVPPGAPADMGAVSPARSDWARGEGHYRRRLLNFYQHYNPSKLPSVRLALQEYKGQEEQLIQNLVNKYGPEPPDLFKLPLPPGWRLVENAAGDVFYVSQDNKKQWERPVGAAVQ
eukprot:TRINITY_DN25644_c0_g1_i1.p1 TRINITY_DN25644_c0_g1~~TRINITY_DN25644_c0_g1_i1.p1  ORF type:complete len:461 (+),score=178.74 TRINITY_DN25644_c0_g1_i1:55-1437(+)